jgi:transcriptional regulator with XRE-family HTH domain
LSEVAGKDGVAPRQGDFAHDLRMRIRELIRDARTAKHLSQSALGDLVGISRFTVMRYERGDLPLPLRMAEQLDKALDLDELSALVRRLEGLAGVNENRRDVVLERLLLDTQALESVTIAVADDLDVFELIYDIGQNRPRLDAREVRIIFPSVERERQLFGGQPLYAHIERQIKRLVDLRASEHRPFDSLQIFESDSILASCVVARTRSSSECAVWSAIPVAGQVAGATLPITSSADPSTAGRVEEYVKHLVSERDSLRSNEALCRVDGKGADAGSRFTRFFSPGIDAEEDVAEDEGFAVALVLAIALCPRAHYGLGRRLVTYKRPGARHDRERLSLFSNNVDDADMRMARAIESNSPTVASRSTRTALAAALDINDYVTASGGLIPDSAYKLAAVREFATFGLAVDPGRLRSLPLPPELRLIRKPEAAGRRRASLVPHLFAFELDPHGDEPELDILEASADIEVVGIDDLAESTSLNSFLQQARDGGLLIPMLSELGLVQR